MRYDDLPGADLVLAGIRDVALGVPSVEALLIEIAAPRLRFVGLDVPPIAPAAEAAELRLYAFLGASGALDAYSTYNALLRELTSFGSAAEHRMGAELRAAEET